MRARLPPFRRALAAALVILGATGCNAIFGLDPGTLDVDSAHYASKGQEFSFSLAELHYDTGLGQVVDAHATLDHDFALDAHEVTVARFKAWLAAGKIQPGVGESLDPGGPYEADMIWLTQFDIGVSFVTFSDDSQCQGAFPVPNEASTFHQQSNDDMPMTCVTWWHAAAFCAFEGKRLPTSAEWQYAVQSGPANAPLPFTPSGDPFACADVTYAREGNPEFCGFPVNVGTATGQTAEGVFDLGGSVVEWVWDGAVEPVPSDMSSFTGAPGNAARRTARGAGYYSAEDDFVESQTHFIGVKSSASEYLVDQPGGATPDAGFRCARTLE
ncbi:MAG TPA: SUMF1/EgtB/PvdO family nonheme iron enzyme [Byssovorax sp.]